MSLKVYGPAMSRIGRITWCAGEAGVACEQIDIPWSALKEADFLAINPNGKSLFGRAVAHASADLRLAGWGYGVALVLFVVSGFTVSVAQPVLAAVACAAAVLIALRLPGAVGPAG